MAEPKQYPECEKLEKLHPEICTIQRFLEWLVGENLTIGEYTRVGFVSVANSHPFLIYQYFKIDMEKVEKERSQMIADLQSKTQ